MHRPNLPLCLFLTLALLSARASPALLGTQQESDSLDSQSGSASEAIDFNSVSDEEVVFEKHTGLRPAIFLFHLLTLAVALYACFFGFRHYKLLLCAQAFVVSYFFLVLILRHAGVFKPERLSHQFGIFLSALFLAGNLLLACSVFIRLNYAFFGFSLATVAYFLTEERFGHLHGFGYAFYFILTIFGVAVPGALLTFKMFRYAVPAVSALVGGFFGLVCLEVLTQNFSRFYDLNFLRQESLAWFVAGWLVLAASGFVFQVRMKRISDKLTRESDLEQINRRSYLA